MTYVGAGETVISATAKDTAIKVEVTIVVTDKGSKEQPLSVDEAIALMDTAGDGVILGDANNKFYITGKVEEGSVFADSKWMVNLLGTDSKKLQAVFDHSTAYSKLYVSPESGKLDNYNLVLQVSLKKDGGTYTVVEASVDSGTRPAVVSIKIDEAAEVKMPIHAKLNVREVLPANAQLDGTEQWHSSDESKATVDNKGEVTGVAAGNVQVWVSFGEVQSNKCTVTITQQETSNKIVYDWTTSLTADSVVDDVYTIAPSSRKDHKTEYLDAWTPGQTEITALKFKEFFITNTKANAGGFAFFPVVDAGTADITTAHKIKKVTFKVVAFIYADTIKMSVNGQQVVHEKNGATYNGKLDSAFEVTVELPEATDTIQIGAALELNNAFAIVGMTLEW